MNMCHHNEDVSSLGHSQLTDDINYLNVSFLLAVFLNFTELIKFSHFIAVVLKLAEVMKTASAIHAYNTETFVKFLNKKHKP